jgi:hypothetical protein
LAYCHHPWMESLLHYREKGHIVVVCSFGKIVS